MQMADSNDIAMTFHLLHRMMLCCTFQCLHSIFKGNVPCMFCLVFLGDISCQAPVAEHKVGAGGTKYTKQSRHRRRGRQCVQYLFYRAFGDQYHKCREHKDPFKLFGFYR